MELPSHSVQGRGFSSPGEWLPSSFQSSVLPEPGPWRSPIKFTMAPSSAAGSKIPGILALLEGSSSQGCVASQGQRFWEQPCVTRP